jgi:effector-binding domain-containing protein
MAGSVKLEERKAFTLAYVEHMGDCSGIPFAEYIDRLYSWAKKRNVRPGFHPMGIFLDAPGSRPPGKHRSEVGISIAEKVRASSGIKVRNVPAMKVAAISHKGPAEEYSATYAKLGDWIVAHGYEWAGPCIEVYSKRPETVDGKGIIYAKVMAPVKKRRH